MFLSGVEALMRILGPNQKILELLMNLKNTNCRQTEAKSCKQNAEQPLEGRKGNDLRREIP